MAIVQPIEMTKGGRRQVDGAKLVMGHAYGGGSQFLSMWLVGSEKP